MFGLGNTSRISLHLVVPLSSKFTLNLLLAKICSKLWLLYQLDFYQYDLPPLEVVL